VIIEKTFGEKIDIAFRQALPFASAFLAALLMVTQTHVPFLNSVMPSLTLCVVYFWAVHRPELFGLFSAFVIGLIQDLLSGVPLGLMTLTLLLTQSGVASQSLFFRDKPFIVHWWGFAIVAAYAAILTWIVAAIVLGLVAPFSQVLISAILTILIFPLVFWMCNIIERRIMAVL